MPAPKGNRNAAGNRGGGRPTKYKAEFAEMAFRIALLGATDAELAEIFGVAETTINAWKRDHVEFSEALKKGKDRADARVADSLYSRALGYSHDAVKIAVDANTGKEKVVPYVKHYPPDTTACIFWLKNRQREHWRDKQEIGHSVEEGGVLIVPAPVTTEDWAAAAENQQRATAAKRAGEE